MGGCKEAATHVRRGFAGRPLGSCFPLRLSTQARSGRGVLLRRSFSWAGIGGCGGRRCLPVLCVTPHPCVSTRPLSVGGQILD